MTWFITPASAEETPAVATPPADAAQAVPAADAAEQAAPAADAAQDGHSVAGTAAEGGHSEVFPPFNPEHFASQLLWLAIAFGLLYWMISKIAAPRIGGILEARRERIQADLTEAERARAETDAAIAAYEQSLAEAKAKASAIATETRERVAKELDARRKGVEEELHGKLAAAETEISAIKTKALGDVDAIATETAEAIVTMLIGKSSREEAAAAVSGVTRS